VRGFRSLRTPRHLEGLVCVGRGPGSPGGATGAIIGLHGQQMLDRAPAGVFLVVRTPDLEMRLAIFCMRAVPS
jgi:hypothetical protein